MKIKTIAYRRADGLEISNIYDDSWQLKCLVENRVAFYSFKDYKWVWASYISFNFFSDFETNFFSAYRALETLELPTSITVGPRRLI